MAGGRLFELLERYPNYWNKGNVFMEKVIYLPIVDATVRLANLKSGQAVLTSGAGGIFPNVATSSTRAMRRFLRRNRPRSPPASS